MKKSILLVILSFLMLLLGSCERDCWHSDSYGNYNYSIYSEVDIRSNSIRIDVYTYGDFEADQYGICYAENNPEPTLSDNVISKQVYGFVYQPEFQHVLTRGKFPNTASTYYIRPFVKNPSGVLYGDVFEFIPNDIW